MPVKYTMDLLLIYKLIPKHASPPEKIRQRNGKMCRIINILISGKKKKFPSLNLKTAVNVPC